MPAKTLEPYLEKWALPACPPEKLAYFAGFFDGEGCIQFHRNTCAARTTSKEAGTGLSINAVNTVQAPLEEMQHYFGGTIHTKIIDARFNKKPSFCWMLHGKKAAFFLNQIVEHLLIKRQQAEAALLFAETFFADWRHVKQRGWPLTEEARTLRRLTFRAHRRAINSGRSFAWQL